jgi:hypothetical protein
MLNPGQPNWRKLLTFVSRSSHPTVSVAPSATNIKGLSEALFVLALLVGDVFLPALIVATESWTPMTRMRPS